MITKESIIRDALSLSDGERREVISRLTDSLSKAEAEEIAEAWDREIERRMEEVLAGRAKFIPWEEARQRIFTPPNGFKS